MVVVVVVVVVTLSSVFCEVKESGRLTKDGYMIVMSEKTRRQDLNRADAIDKLRDIIQAAADDRPYQPTAEELAILQHRYDNNRSCFERLNQK